MKQSRLMSFVESFINILVGFGISLGAQILFLPMLGVQISYTQNFVFAVIMTVISICRSYILRRLFEALHIRRPLSPFMHAVVAERYRQIEVEGWSTEHDDKHARGDLALAGACYSLIDQRMQISDARKKGASREINALDIWKWDRRWWKPGDVRRNYIKSAALIIAEGERFDRLKTKRLRVLIRGGYQPEDGGSKPALPTIGSGVRARRT